MTETIKGSDWSDLQPTGEGVIRFVEGLSKAL